MQRFKENSLHSQEKKESKKDRKEPKSEKSKDKDRRAAVLDDNLLIAN
jgi:ribosomal protein S25